MRETICVNGDTTLTAEEIKDVYEAMMDRQRHESKWVKSNGETDITDVGYATDGAFLFYEEIMRYARAKQKGIKVVVK